MSDLTYQELRDSEDPVKRLEYARRIQEDIDLTRKVLATTQTMRGPFHAELKASLVEMEDRLAEYDVYRQKTPYQCWRCKESECICNSL